MSENNEFLVIYVFSKFDNIERFSNFINSYKKFPSGYPHKLVLCFKILDKEKLILCRSIAKDIKYDEFLDPIKENDFEFKTMERAIKNYSNQNVLFLISHCQIEKSNCLKIIKDSFLDNSYMGFSGSNESIFSSLEFKKFWKIYSYLKQYFNLKKKFNKFPNPHIRGPSFVLKQKDFLDFIKDKHYLDKMDAVMTECGKNSMTNYFVQKGYNVYIINSSGIKFDIKDMEKSMTYCNTEVSDVLISDRHHRKFQFASSEIQNKIRKKVWFNF